MPPKATPAHVRAQQINELPNITFVRWADVYKNNRSKAVCRCAIDGHEWEATVCNLVRGRTGCPKCAGLRHHWSAEERIAQINALPNISFIRWEDGYSGVFSKAVCQCEIDGHEWTPTVNNLVNNRQGCPACGREAMARANRVPVHIREQQINELPNIEFVRWADVYRDCYSKAICKCAVDGFEWAARVTGLLDSGTGCPQCYKNSLRTSKDCEQQINELPNIEFVRWAGAYKNARSKAICRCTVNGFEWAASVSKLINDRSGCPDCNRGPKHTANERITQINAKPNVTFVRWEGAYRGVWSKAVCQCSVDGFKWVSTVNGLINSGHGCPSCAKGGYDPNALGTLYVLRSECGSMVKIGISNDHQDRHRRLKLHTPFDWHCIELLHGDGAIIAEFEKEFHSFTEPATFSQTFDGYTEWRKWDDRLPMWIKRHRKRLERYNKAP